MMPAASSHHGRGLTLVELMISLAITVMVGAAMMALLVAVARATEMGVQTREVVIRAHAINSRVSLYTDPSLALLDVRDDGEGFVLWLSDTRASSTVHASEIRWLSFDAAQGTLTVDFVKFPDGWSQTLVDTWDNEYLAAGFGSADAWWSVRDDYESLGYLSSTLIGDQLSGLTATYIGADEYDADRLLVTYHFQEMDGDQADILCVAAFEDHLAPQ